MAQLLIFRHGQSVWNLENKFTGWVDVELSPKGIELYNLGKPITELKDYLTYKLMIRQPNFVNKDTYETFKKLTFIKTKNKKILDVKFEIIKEGLVCQMLHFGSYDNEPISFKKMEDYCNVFKGRGNPKG